MCERKFINFINELKLVAWEALNFRSSFLNHIHGCVSGLENVIRHTLCTSLRRFELRPSNPVVACGFMGYRVF